MVSIAVRANGARRVIVAVPVAPRQVCDELAREADQVICAATPHPFGAVGFWYEDFSQVTDQEVRKLLQEGALEAANGRARGEMRLSHVGV